MKPKLRGVTVEKIAKLLLEEEGFTVIEERKRVKRNDIDVAEIDLLAKKNGEVYAVEVKAGRVSVTDLRQVYTNAKLVEARPIIICRGYADKAAEELAKALNVEVLFLSDYLIFLEPEELVNIVERTLTKLLIRILEPQLHVFNEEEFKLLQSIAYCKDFPDLVRKTGISARELRELINSLKLKGFENDPKNYDILRLQALVAMLLGYNKGPHPASELDPKGD